MAEILVQENAIHIDDADMATILESLSENGLSAEAVKQSTWLKAARWVLVLVWIGGDLSHMAFDKTLEDLAKKHRQHYKDRDKAPPARIDLVDESDNPIASLEIEEDDPPS